MEKKKRAFSLRIRLIQLLLLIAVPMVVLLLGYNYYLLRVSNQELTQSGQRDLSAYTQKIEGSLEVMDALLFNMTYDDPNFNTLSRPASELDAHVAGHYLASQLHTMSNVYNNAGALFLYSAPNDLYRDVMDTGYTYEQREALQRQLRQLARQACEGAEAFSGGWTAIEAGGQYYLLHLAGRDGACVGAVVDFDRLARVEHIGADAQVVFASAGDLLPLYNGGFVEEQGVRLEENQRKEGYFTGSGRQYLALGEQVGNSNIFLYFFIPQTNLFSRMQGMQAILLLLSGAGILMIAMSFLWLKRTVLSQLDKLLHSIGKPGKAREGAGGGYDIEEFKQVDSAITGMQTRIDELKLLTYEKEIERQKAELQYLQLQIRPHFFLNCLKGLYGMAQQKRYVQIQEMVLAISSHLRYSFKDAAQMVPLRDEVGHIQNYMHIQQMGSAAPPVCHCDIPPEYLALPVPPLSVQTFVENCVKHAVPVGRRLEVFLKVICLRNEQGSYLDITIEDNGQGFAPDVLSALQSGELAQLYSEQHVGIRNVATRLSLLYEGRAMLAFFNGTRGAVAELLLPCVPQPGEETI